MTLNKIKSRGIPLANECAVILFVYNKGRGGCQPGQRNHPHVR